MLPSNHKYYKKKKGDALAAERINRMLNPDMRAQIAEAKEFFDDSKRAGAGGTKSGSVGLRMIGRKSLSSLYEKYTETGKASKPTRRTVNLHEFVGKPVDQPRVRVCSVPTNYCPDCDTAKTSGRFEPYVWFDKNGTRQETAANISLSPVMEPIPEIEMRPGDVIRFVTCGKCNYLAEKGTDSRLYLVINGEQVSMKVYETFQRNQRIEENLIRFLRWARTVGKEKTFVGEQGEDLLNER